MAHDDALGGMPSPLHGALCRTGEARYCVTSTCGSGVNTSICVCEMSASRGVQQTHDLSMVQAIPWSHQPYRTEKTSMAEKDRNSRASPDRQSARNSRSVENCSQSRTAPAAVAQDPAARHMLEPDRRP